MRSCSDAQCLEDLLPGLPRFWGFVCLVNKTWMAYLPTLTLYSFSTAIIITMTIIIIILIIITATATASATATATATVPVTELQ